MSEELIEAILGVKRRNDAQKLKRIKKFENINQLLEYLANASTKERADFLKLWKTKAAKDGVGRKKTHQYSDDMQLYEVFENIKARENLKSNRKAYEWLIQTFAEDIECPNKRGDYIDWARVKRGNICNRLTHIRKKYSLK